MTRIQNTLTPQRYMSLVIALLMSGCIGENPDTKKADTATTTTTPAATPTPAKPAAPTPAATTTADGRAIEFIYVSNSFPSTLYRHYAGFSQNNTSLDKRNQMASEGGFASLLKDIDLWSNKNLWKYDDGRKLNDIPAEGAIATIKNQSGPSVVQVDGAYTLEQLTLDASSGMYVPKDGALLAQTLNFKNNSFAIVPEGRIGGQTLEMREGSFMDLVGGNGCVINAELADLKVDDSNPKGVLTLGENGSVSINSAYISAHKIEQQGDIKVSQAIFNLQPVVSGTMTNIEYLHKKGKIQQLPGRPEFVFKVNGLYKMKADAEIEMFVYGDSPHVAPIQLIHKPDLPVTSAPTEDDKPSIEGKILLAPYGTITPMKGIVLINSDVEFSQATHNNVSRILHEASKKIGKHTFDLKISTDKKQILLDITGSPSLALLKATPPMQDAATSFRQGVFKSRLLDSTPSQVTKMKLGKVELFTSHDAVSSSYRSAQSTVFGVKHQIAAAQGHFDVQQTWGRTHVADYIYRYVPEADKPFWIVQNAVSYNLPFSFGEINLTPSAGLAHLAVPETAFQHGFQTVIPMFGVKSGFKHRIDSSVFEVNVNVSAEYQHGLVHLNDQPWGINTGVSMKLQLPSIELSAAVVNPFQPVAEVYMNISATF